jgi:hypothetical protein
MRLDCMHVNRVGNQSAGAELPQKRTSVPLNRKVPLREALMAAVGGGTMPDAEQLPDDIAELHNLNAVEISDRSFSVDVEKLMKAIGRMGRTTTSLPIAAEITPAIGK